MRAAGRRALSSRFIRLRLIGAYFMSERKLTPTHILIN